MGQGSKAGIAAETGACPIPPFPLKRKREPWRSGTIIMSVGFSAMILSNLFLVTVPPLVIPLAFPIPPPPPGTNVFLARTGMNGNLHWSHSFGGLDRDVGYTVIECYEGGFAVAGSTHSYGHGSSSMWLLRTNSTGHPIWNQTYGGTDWDECYDLVECLDGGFAITGETLSFGEGGKDVILVRTDILGEEMLMNTFGGPEDDRGSSIVRCGDSGFVISATTSSFGAGSSDMWLIRTDASGEVMWDKTFGEEFADEANSVTLCNDGGFLLVGTTTIALTTYLCLIRTDSYGNEIWKEAYGTAGTQGWSAVECADGGFAVIGTDDEPFQLTDLEDIIFYRVDSSGVPIWSQEYGGGEVVDSYAGYSVLACNDDGFIIAGKFGFHGSQNDIWIARTDAEGEIIWSANYQGFHTGFGFCLGECSDGGIIITAGVETPAEPVVVGQVASSSVNSGLNVVVRKPLKPVISAREYET
ncbi:MAG: hypothetical protein ACXADO_01845 [Candidatus Thorarchaeota archaeon]